MRSRLGVRGPTARRTGRAVLLGAVLAGLAACGSPQPPRFHSLVPAPAAAAPAGVLPAGAVAWEILPVTVPPGVDQPQWVVRSVDGSLVVLEQERWVAPLAEEVRAALAARIEAELGTPAAKAAPAWRVRVEVSRFEAAPVREARLEATWTILGDDGSVAARCRGEFVEAPSAEGYLALAAGLRAVVARAGDAAAISLKAAASGRAGVCKT